MIITKNALEHIFKIANSKKVELGGILGTDNNEIISRIVTDSSENSFTCKFDYYPNIDFLNKEIESWAKQGISFMGIFHTHFSGCKNLSDADKKYIKEIMICSKGITEHLYFPVFTLPDNELNVYKASFKGKEVIIQNDKLMIV